MRRHSRSTASCGGVGSRDPIDLGILIMVSGDSASGDADLLPAAELALEEINQAGGVLGGAPLRFKVRDSGPTVEMAKASYATLLQLGVPVVIGPTDSANVVAIAPQIAPGGTVTISPIATAASLSQLDDGGLFYRTTPSDAAQGLVLADLVVSAGVQHLCLVHRRDPYGTGLADSIVERLAVASATTTVVRADYDPAAEDLSRVLDPCDDVRGRPASGIVFLTFSSDGVVLIEDAGRRGWQAARNPFFLCDGNKDPGILRGLTSASILEGALGTVPSGPDPGSQAGARYRSFSNRLAERIGHPPAACAECIYDAVYVAASAIEVARSATDRGAIAHAMSSLSTGPAVETGSWAAIRDAIRARGSVDLKGIVGSLDFDAAGDVLPPHYIAVWRVTNGDLETVRVVTVEP